MEYQSNNEIYDKYKQHNWLHNPIIPYKEYNLLQFIGVLTSMVTRNNYLDFWFLHRLNHEAVILGKVKEAPTFPGWRQLPQSIIATDGEHVICWINSKQLPQMPAVQNPTPQLIIEH